MLPVKLSHNILPCGLFGAVRKFDIHTGIDLYCNEGCDVICIRSGIVSKIFQFTGKEVGSPWWNTTEAVVISDEKYDLLYGEIKVDHYLKVGSVVREGDYLGKVSKVLIKDKGLTPTSMLHLEVWQKDSFVKDYVWMEGIKVVEGIINPLELFDKAVCGFVIKTECGYKVEDSCGNYLKFFDMAADCKAFCMDSFNKYIYLTQKSSIEERFQYFLNTGKFLWFERLTVK